jgi:hypothetical protein
MGPIPRDKKPLTLNLFLRFVKSLLGILLLFLRSSSAPRPLCNRPIMLSFPMLSQRLFAWIYTLASLRGNFAEKSSMQCQIGYGLFDLVWEIELIFYVPQPLPCLNLLLDLLAFFLLESMTQATQMTVDLGWPYCILARLAYNELVCTQVRKQLLCGYYHASVYVCIGLW